VSQTLALLDGGFAALAEGVNRGEYAFWLGSGISRERVEGLDGLLLKLLEYLRDRRGEARFKDALDEVLAKSEMEDGDLAAIDFDVEARSWPKIAVILGRLARRYSSVLGVRVGGEEADFLLWDAVDVRVVYPRAKPPDCEHLCLALLGLEGVTPNIASANWDGLIESALDDLTGDTESVLKVVVLPGELRGPGRRIRLIKFHGCAVLAADDPAMYREALIAREAQIDAWPHDGSHAAIRAALESIATSSATLMIGLSAQDSNIRALFYAAKETMAWVWPSNPTPYVFAGDQLDENHRVMLEVVYGDSYDLNRSDIETAALLRAYAKPALVALVLRVVASKLKAVARTNASALVGDMAGLATIDLGIDALRDALAHHAGLGTLEFIKSFLRVHRRIASIFATGEEPDAGDMTYRPVTAGPTDQASAEPGLDTSGVRELATAIGLLGRGHRAGTWVVDLGLTLKGTNGAIRVTAGARQSAVFFAANPSVESALRRNGLLDRSSDAVVIHSSEPAKPRPRTPRAVFGRIGASGPRHVAMGPPDPRCRQRGGCCESIPARGSALSATPLIRPALAILEEAGFRTVDQPMTVGSVPFEFDAVLVHSESLDLVVIEQTSLHDTFALPSKVDGLARALDVLGSRRSLTLVLVGPRPENPVIDRLSRVSRVLFADVPEDGDVNTAFVFALAVLLPLNVEPAPDEPAESWRSVAANLRSRIQDRELSPILTAASRGSGGVTRALRDLLAESFGGVDD
jgi:hypothetical protein